MKTILYLGTDPTRFRSQGHAKDRIIHYPIIKIVPRSLAHPELKQAYAALSEYTHLIFTSKNAVKIFFGHLADLKQSADVLKIKTTIAIGKVTAAYLAATGIPLQFVAHEETQEGIVQLLDTMHLENTYIFMPRSSLSRPVLTHFFKQRRIRFQACDLYDTLTQALEPKPDLDQVDEILFTSPSTVHAFLEIFGTLPKGKKLMTIGSVTEKALTSLSTKTVESYTNPQK
jgi:uroporphyrinogen-III synthase